MFVRRGLLSLSVSVSVAALALTPSLSAGRSTQPTLAQLVGQHLLVRMRGSTPSASFLARIGRGEIGGVVLFQNNIPSAGVRSLIAELQSAARAGGQLPLLVAVDQEGGTVKRLPGPPSDAPSAMRSPSEALAQGTATGRYLKQLGIGLDLAPVLDVPASPSAFIAARTFSSSAAAVGSRGVAFGEGLVRGGVAASAKHFPGLGRLIQSTDYAPGRITATRSALVRDLAPFRAAVRVRVPAIMVGTAIYPAYGSEAPAACSPAIVEGLLRHQLGFHGVVISDDLDTAGVWSSIPPPQAVVRAVQATVDMVYIAGVNGSGGDAIGEEAYTALLRAAQQRLISQSQLEASYARILRLKQQYAGA
jgi:beta-N-acetylhexosaminidase